MELLAINQSNMICPSATNGLVVKHLQSHKMVQKSQIWASFHSNMNNLLCSIPLLKVHCIENMSWAALQGMIKHIQHVLEKSNLMICQICCFLFL